MQFVSMHSHTYCGHHIHALPRRHRSESTPNQNRTPGHLKKGVQGRQVSGPKGPLGST